MQIVTGRRGEPHVTSRQMQAVYRSFLGDFALLDIGEKLRAEAYSNDIVRVYDGVVSVQGIYAVIAYNQYDEVYIEPVSVGKKRIDTIVLHYTKDNALDVEDMQLDVVQGEEYTDNPIAPVVPEGGDAWEGTTDIQVAIYDVEVTNFGLTVTPYARILNLIPTLESIAERIPETVVTGVKGDSEVLYRYGNVNITKENIGLGNVDNTADTDKPISTATQTALNLKADLAYVDAKISAAYHAGGNLTVAELTSALLITENMGKVYNMSDSGVTTSDFVEGAGKSILEGDNVGICNVGTEESPVYKFDLLSGFVDLSAYATTSAVNTGLAGKVDKVTGKGLSTEDYTTIDKTKLAGISEGATQTIANPADTATETLSKLEVEGVVYDVPQGASGATELSELTDVNLSNVEDNNILQYDETANKWKNSNALQGVKTATGNPLTIEDAAPVNAVNLSMDLEPIQDLHGYDHPWVGGAGKNLYIGSPSFDGYSSLSEWTKDSSTYNGHDVYKRNVEWTGCYKMIYLPVGTYTFSVMVKGDDYKNCAIYMRGKDGTGVARPSNYDFTCNTSWTRESVTFQVTTAGTFAIRVEKKVNDSAYIYISEYQLEAGNQATAYAPYENICPISGRSEVAIKRVGKNLYPITVGEDYWDNNAGGTHSNNNGELVITVNNNNYSGVYSSDTNNILRKTCLALSNFTISADVKASANMSVKLSNVEVQLTTSYQRLTFGTSTMISIYGTGTAGTIYVKNLQLELGTTATDFEPYKGKTYTIQLGDTVYGGTLDVTRGKMVVDRGYIASYNGETLPSTWISDRDVYASGTTPTIGAEVVYELATPITIPLTPQQIKLLENTNTIYTDNESDTITLEYQPNNAIGEAVRAVEESYDPEFAVRPPLKKKAFSGTTDSDGSVTLINASDIPSNHRIIPLQITDMTIGGSAGTYFVEYKPYNSGDSVKGYCYTYYNGSQITPVGSAVTGNFYYYELEV